MTRKRGTVAVPAPIVEFGDRCMVQNYRCRPPKWEPGTVTALKLSARWSPELHWTYEVALDRPRTTRRGNEVAYTLTVGDGGVCPIQEGGPR
jgi:hypothetical protein